MATDLTPAAGVPAARAEPAPPPPPPPPPLPAGEQIVTLNDTILGALGDAEILLAYAAEAGIDTPTELVEAILNARIAAAHGSCTRTQLVGFYAGFTKLAARLYPVSADTIRACSAPEAARSLRRNRFWAIVLTAVIVVLSIITFVDTSIATKIAADIADTNASAVKLRTMLGTPGAALAIGQCKSIATPDPAGARSTASLDGVTQLQQFAAGVRDIYGKAIKLNYFVAKIERDPLPDKATRDGVGLADLLQLNPALVNYDAEIVCKISTYEEVRSYAQNILLDNSVAFGALAAYVLPVAYSLLGAMAFRLRTFADTIRKRTYHPSYADSARMMAAAIAGAIVSLFNNFTQGVSLSPLAVAFLIGYGVEIFFTFLDTILNSFGAGTAGRRPPPPPVPQ